jgi:hypothetical protein
MRVAPAMTQGLNRSERRPSRNSACGRSRWLAGGRCSSVCWDDTCRCNTACIGAQIAVSTRRSGSGSGHNLRAGLGWAGLGWAGLGWAGLGWAGLGWAGLGWAGLGWAGLGWAAVCRPERAVSRTVHQAQPLAGSPTGIAGLIGDVADGSRTGLLPVGVGRSTLC